MMHLKFGLHYLRSKDLNRLNSCIRDAKYRLVLKTDILNNFYNRYF